MKALSNSDKGGLTMRLHKSVLGLLCLMLIFMVACSSNGGSNNNMNSSTVNESSNNGNNATDTTDENTEEAVENPNATPEMDFDMGGRTIKLVSWYDEAIQETSPDGIAMKQNLDALMEKHNFTVEYVVVDYGEYSDKVKASLMAGEPIGDIIRLARPWMIPSLVQQDLFWSLDDYVINDNAFRLQYTSELSAYDGKGYGFRIGVAGAGQGVFYNRTLMNQLGLKNIQDYADADTWNWDTFIEVAKSANQDTNNDGKIDTWGLATSSILIQALAANETNMFVDGKQNLEDPKTVEAMSFISRLATEDVARPTEGGDWTEPKQFFIQGNTLMFVGADYEKDSFNTDMADYDIGFLPFPKGPSGTTYHSFNTIPNYYTIPRAIENPEQIVYLWEKIYDIQSVYDYPRQADLEKWFQNEADVGNARVAADSIRVIEGIDAFPSMPYYDFVGELTSGVSVSTVIEKYKEPFQAAANEVYQ